MAAMTLAEPLCPIPTIAPMSSQADMDAAIEQARAAVKPVSVTVQEGQTIVRDGDIVTSDQREQLEKLGFLQRQLPWSALIGSFGLIALIAVLLAFYLYRFGGTVWRSSRFLVLKATASEEPPSDRLAPISDGITMPSLPLSAMV